MKAYRRSREPSRRDNENKQESTGQAPTILERRTFADGTKPILFDPQNPKKPHHISSSAAPAPQQEQQKQQKHAASGRPFLKKQPTGVSSLKEQAHNNQTAKTSHSVIPFFRRGEQFCVESITKALTDNPGHFVVGIIGQQGVGKSTILSSFTELPAEAFPSQPNDLFLAHGHKTMGIDIRICPEGMILLDTEPLFCWTVLEKVLWHHSTDGLHPDVWLEMEALYNLIFLLSVCNVVMVVFEGTSVDIDMIHCLQRAEMLKFQLADFPLMAPSNYDMNYYSDIVFVCNKCHEEEFTLSAYHNVKTILEKSFHESQLKIHGIGSLGKILPAYSSEQDMLNLYFLPYDKQLWAPQSNTQQESFQVITSQLRNHIMAGPRRQGKKGQVSEKEWFRNAVKLYELVRNSDYVNDYVKTFRKLRET